MSQQTPYEKYQAALVEHQRKQQQEEARKASEIEEGAKRLIHVLECKINDGVTKGETEFSVDSNRHNADADAIARAVEILQKMGFPPENISCVNRYLKVRIDLPADNVQKKAPASVAELAHFEPESRRREAEEAVEKFAALKKQFVFDSGGKSITLKISSSLMRLFECDRRDWIAFRSAVLQRVESPGLSMSFDKVNATVTLRL